MADGSCVLTRIPPFWQYFVFQKNSREPERGMEQLEKIRRLRQETKTLVKSLYDAAQDKESIESILGPVSDSLPESPAPVIPEKPSRVVFRHVKSPKKVRPAVFSAERRRESQKSTESEKNLNVLNKSDDYYAELQEFRRLHSDECSKRVLEKRRIKIVF